MILSWEIIEYLKLTIKKYKNKSKDMHNRSNNLNVFFFLSLKHWKCSLIILSSCNLSKIKFLKVE